MAGKTFYQFHTDSAKCFMVPLSIGHASKMKITNECQLCAHFSFFFHFYLFKEALETLQKGFKVNSKSIYFIK